MVDHASSVGIHRILVPLVGAVLCMALMPAPRHRPAFVEQLVARAVTAAGEESVGRIQILIERWSNDADVHRLRVPLQQGDVTNLLAVLRQPRRRVGVVLMPGVGGRGARARTPTPRNLLFAREITTAAGRRVVTASDEHLGFGEPPLVARQAIPEFNLLEIRFDADGTGVGKVVSAGEAAFDAAAVSLTARDYSNLPVRLVDVRREKP